MYDECIAVRNAFENVSIEETLVVCISPQGDANVQVIKVSMNMHSGPPYSRA